MAKFAVVFALFILSLYGLVSANAKSYISASLYESEVYRVNWVDVLIGSPVQRQSVSFDTGSPYIGVACSSCNSNCNNDKNKIDTLFDYTLSSSLKFIDCKSGDCCVNSDKSTGRCSALCNSMGYWKSRTTNPLRPRVLSKQGNSLNVDVPLKREETVELIVPLPNGEKFRISYSHILPGNYNGMVLNQSRSINGAVSTPNSICGSAVNYGEGDGIWGPLFKDTIAFGDSKDRNLAIEYPGIMCYFARDGHFARSNLSGIVGASYGAGIPSKTMMDIAYSDPRVNKNVFGVCASQQGGLLTIGGFDSSLFAEKEFTYVPMVSKNIFYAVNVNSVKFGSATTNAPAGSPFQFIFDTGTTNLLLPGIVFSSVNTSLNNICNQHRAKKGGITCVRDLIFNERSWIVENSADLSIFPEISFEVVSTDGKKAFFNISHKNYLRKVTDGNSVDLFLEAIVSSKKDNIIGSLAQRNFYIAFDTDEKRLGFVEANCPITDPANRENITLPPQETISNIEFFSAIVMIAAIFLIVISVGAAGFYGYIFYRRKKKAFPSLAIAQSDNEGTEFVRLNRLSRLEHGRNPSLLTHQVS